MTSRRAVLGTALGGTALATLPGTGAAQADPAHDAAGGVASGGSGPWRLRNRMASDTAWSAFLRGQDLLWRRMPTLWHEGPFLGDGRLGNMVYQEPGKNSVRFTASTAKSSTTRPSSAAAGAPAGCPWDI
ncbi:hypothetical protein GCM10023083_84030 [Streptomyces phyllanthi]